MADNDNINSEQLSIRSLKKDLGVTGLQQYGGILDEEWLTPLKGIRKPRTLREMADNDAIIGAILFAIEMLIRQVVWSVEPGSTDNEDVEAAEFIESCLDDMSHTWEDVISEILSMLVYGYSFHEIVYKSRLGDSRDPTKKSKYNDGRIGWRKLPIRAQNTLYKWVLDDSGGIQAFYQHDYTTGHRAAIPLEKGLLFRTTKRKNNPEGRSILRNAYRSWYFKKRIEEVEGIGIERDLAGLPVLYVPNKYLLSGATAAEQATIADFKNIIRNLRRDEQEGLILPGDRDSDGNRKFEFSLLSTGSRRQFDTTKIIERYDRRIAMTVLADFILIGHEKVGSFSLSSDKTSLFSTAIGTFLGEIKSVFNRHAIPRLLKLNGMLTDNPPKLTHDDLEVPDLTKLGEFVAKLSGAGMELFPDDNLENTLRRYAGWPEKVEDDFNDTSTPPDNNNPQKLLDSINQAIESGTLDKNLGQQLIAMLNTGEM